MRRDGSDTFLWLAAGITVGVVAGLALAPRPGSETRRLLRRRVEEAQSFLAERGTGYLDRGRDLYDRGRGMADEAAEMFDEGRRIVEGEGT